MCTEFYDNQMNNLVDNTSHRHTDKRKWSICESLAFSSHGTPQKNYRPLYRETIAVCPEIDAKHIKILRGQQAEFPTLNLAEYKVTTGLYKAVRHNWKFCLGKNNNSLNVINYFYVTSISTAIAEFLPSIISISYSNTKSFVRHLRLAQRY